MRGEKLRAIAFVAALATASVLALEAAGAQESWQPARGGASAWGSGPAPRSTPVAGTGAFGGGANWTAGKGSFGLARQPGGVWTAGPAMPTANKSALGPIATEGAPSRAMPKQIGFRLAAPTGTPSAPEIKTQIHQAHSSQKSAAAPHFGMPTRSRSRNFKFSSAKSTALASRSRASSNSRTGKSSSFSKPKTSREGHNPFGGSSSSSEEGFGTLPEIDESSH
jgi:hypothetical protein